ncbi:MAG: CoA transferase [Chloroflexota bacterium]
MPAPLSGVRIIAVEQFGAGPFATLYLADLGAEIIKIEDPHTGGDVGRYIPPGQIDAGSLYFESFNRGKRSVLLDLKNSRGRDLFRQLVADSDAVFNNVRGDQVERLGLSYAALKSVNPRIVCASLSGYGRTGAEGARPGYDALVQAEAGWAAMTGDPEGPPVKSGLSLADYAAGLMAALGLMVALFNVRRTGCGCDVDTSLYSVALGMLTYPATWYLSAGIETQRHAMSAHPSVVPFQFFQTADGHIAIACPKEKFFRALATGIGLPGLLDDPRFDSFADRVRHRDALLAILAERFRIRSTGDWMALLGERIPCAPVRSLAEALDLEELDARRALASYQHPIFGDVRHIGMPLTLGNFEPTYRPAPALGADTRSILQHLRYTDEQIDDLAREGAFGRAAEAD